MAIKQVSPTDGRLFFDEAMVPFWDMGRVD
jgi:hypothetical protein